MILGIILVLIACLGPSLESSECEDTASLDFSADEAMLDFSDYDAGLKCSEDEYRVARQTQGQYQDESQDCVCPSNVTAAGYNGDPLTCGIVTGTLLAYHCPCETVSKFPPTCVQKIGEDVKAKDPKFTRTARALSEFAREHCPSHLSEDQARGLGDMIADVASRFQSQTACEDPQECAQFQRGGACFLYGTGVEPQSRGQENESSEKPGSPGKPGKPGSQFLGYIKPFMSKVPFRRPGQNDAVSDESNSTSSKAQ